MKNKFPEKRQASSKQRNRNKKEIHNIIQNLVKRRQQHEARISKLLDPNYQPQDITEESVKQNCHDFTQMLEQMSNEESFPANQVQESAAGLGHHVNLLATVSLKTEYYLNEQSKQRETGELHAQLAHKYANCKVTCSFEEEEPDKLPQLLKQLTKYLIDQSYSQGLFAIIQNDGDQHINDYYGTCFALGKYQQIQLSRTGLSEQERRYLSIKGQETVDISWLLLSRLIGEQPDMTLPRAMNKLFSFPVKTFRVKESLQLIVFNELLGQLAKIDGEKQEDKMQFKVYGIEESTGYSYQIFNLSKAKSLKSYLGILYRFSQLAIIDEQELPVRHIPLSCLKNHFVIVTICVKIDSYYFISVGSDHAHQTFRFILLNSEGKAIQGDVLKCNEFAFCYLKGEEEYEIYISPVFASTKEKGMDQSFELVKDNQDNFSLWIQGKHLYSKLGDLSMQIRLKEEYNTYTLNIARTFLQNSSQKEPQSQSQLHQEQQTVIVRRAILSALNLVVDTFEGPPQKSITVLYKGSNMLCDRFFEQSHATIKAGQSVALYHQAEIESVSFAGEIPSQVEYKVVLSYH